MKSSVSVEIGWFIKEKLEKAENLRINIY